MKIVIPSHEFYIIGQNEQRSVSMAAASQLAAVKMVGANGQISLGKQYAGRQVLVEERGRQAFALAVVLDGRRLDCGG